MSISKIWKIFIQLCYFIFCKMSVLMVCLKGNKENCLFYFVGMVWILKYQDLFWKVYIFFSLYFPYWGLLSVVHCPSSGNFSHFNLLQKWATNWTTLVKECSLEDYLQICTNEVNPPWVGLIFYFFVEIWRCITNDKHMLLINVSSYIV